MQSFRLEAWTLDPVLPCLMSHRAVVHVAINSLLHIEPEDTHPVNR